MAKKSSTTALLNDLIKIINQYNIKMTVRQIYYRAVSAQLVPNSDKSYQRIKSLLGDARKDGTIPFDAIEDRTRTILFVRDSQWICQNRIMSTRYTEEEISVKDFEDGWLRTFKGLGDYYDLPRWYKQPTRVVVLVEKQALQGLFQDVCFDRQVDLLVCRGYPSLTILSDLSKRLLRSTADNIQILYFGDRDPSGLDIDRDVTEKMRDQFGIDFDFERIAITPDQITHYNIPPAPAKMTDSRYKGMLEREGEAIQVELDAIDPPDLQDIIRDSIDVHFDTKIFDEDRADELEKRQGEVTEWVSRMVN